MSFQIDESLKDVELPAYVRRRNGDRFVPVDVGDPDPTEYYAGGSPPNITEEDLASGEPIYWHDARNFVVRVARPVWTTKRGVQSLATTHWEPADLSIPRLVLSSDSPPVVLGKLVFDGSVSAADEDDTAPVRLSFADVVELARRTVADGEE